MILTTIMEKPSCIKEIKKLTVELTHSPVIDQSCIEEVKQIINDRKICDNEKLLKIKHICDSYGK